MAAVIGNPYKRAANDRSINGLGTPESEWLAWPDLARLPSIAAAHLVPPGSRAVVVAPHPDDEVLSVGGLLAMLAKSGTAVCVIAVTDGAASHIDSLEWPRERLLRERPRESERALALLGVATEPVRLDLPDGAVTAEALAARLAPLLQPTDVVFTTWRRDGHPDHDATGTACAEAAQAAGARLVEVPVWAWHWAVPEDARLPWHRARRLALDPEAAERKREAVQCFTSQLNPDPSTGAGPILRSTTVARAARPFEIFFA
ncbi:MAG: PIG-L family deacetylase [Variovorax sp.]|nr:MAG: PIG-L family deacetylase [Variovorax sp.]